MNSVKAEAIHAQPRPASRERGSPLVLPGVALSLPDGAAGG
jgi:hypothetical protein